MGKTAVVFPQILHRLNELTNLQHLAQSLTQNKYSIKVVLRTGKKKKNMNDTISDAETFRRDPTAGQAQGLWWS